MEDARPRIWQSAVSTKHYLLVHKICARLLIGCVSV